MNTPKQAERLFGEKLYGDALPLYSHLFDSTEDNELKAKFGLRLATCCLEENRPQEALATLALFDSSFYGNHALYLMSRSHRQLKQSPQAWNVLKQCSFQNSQRIRSLFALEMGYHCMQMADFLGAEQLFASILKEGGDPIFYECAQLQIAKLLLTKRLYHEALQKLRLLSDRLTVGSLLYTEKLYLEGFALLGLHQEEQAAHCFEELLPKALAADGKWTIHILQILICTHLKNAMKTENDGYKKALFSKTKNLLSQLIKLDSSEPSYLLLSDFYLIKAKTLRDPVAYAKAQSLLNRSDLFLSADGLRNVTLKVAAAAPSYENRSHYYQEMSLNTNYPPEFVARVLFLKGLNDYEEGLRISRKSLSHNKEPLDLAAQAFIQTIQLVNRSDQTAQAYKYLILTYILKDNPSSIQLAKQTLDQFMDHSPLIETLEFPEEIHCLFAWVAIYLNDQEALNKAISLLEHDASSSSSALWKERCLKLLGLICLQLKDFARADHFFHQVLQESAYLSSHGEALFWCGYCAGQQQQESLRKDYFQQAFAFARKSPYAPIAYFHLYSYREYMQGRRKAIKHLQVMPQLFPDHQLLISAYYLMGLYHKKDVLSDEGQVLKRKDLTAAIDAFQKAESTFEVLFKQNCFTSRDITYFTKIRYQSQLERALVNLAIAKQSKGGKRDIHLEYAEEVFKQLCQDFVSQEGLANQVIVQPDCLYPKIWASAEIGLSLVYRQKGLLEKAENCVNQSLQNYRKAYIASGYGLMQAWIAMGEIAQLKGDYDQALRAFLEAENTVNGQLVLSPSEKLDLWIQQSVCYRELNKLDEAMKILSQVINDDVISPLRIKAMFLRSEIYRLQGRSELANKQLEAVAKYEGEWAQKAKEELEKTYGY